MVARWRMRRADAQTGESHCSVMSGLGGLGKSEAAKLPSQRPITVPMSDPNSTGPARGNGSGILREEVGCLPRYCRHIGWSRCWKARYVLSTSGHAKVR